MLFTVPLTLGFHEVIRNGAVAPKLNALFLVNVLPPCSMTEKVPTAYMVLPHCTSWRICSVVVVLAGKWGVPAAGCTLGSPACWSAACEGADCPVAACEIAVGISMPSATTAPIAPASQELRRCRPMQFMLAS